MFKKFEKIINHTIESMYSHIDKNKKTIAFVSYLPNYRNHVGTLHEKFKEAGFNVINIVDKILNDRFERQAPTFLIPKKVLTEQGEIFLDVDIDFIDIIIASDNEAWLKKGKYTPSFLSKKAKKIFLPHDILSNIYRSCFDFFDYNFIPSNIEEITDKKRNHNKNFSTCLIPGGYPKLDFTIKKYNKLKKITKIKEDCILYAPTMTLLGDLFDENAASAVVGYEYQLVSVLLENFKENIIFRPHPHNFNYWRYHIHILKEKFKNNKRVIFNLQNEYIESYLRAKVLVTDVSDTAYTFSFSTLKPSIYFLHTDIKRPCVYNNNIKMIGYKCNYLQSLIKCLRDALKKSEKFSKKILDFRNSYVYNIGKSEKYLLENIDYILNNKINPKWVYL